MGLSHIKGNIAPDPFQSGDELKHCNVKLQLMQGNIGKIIKLEVEMS